MGQAAGKRKPQLPHNLHDEGNKQRTEESEQVLWDAAQVEELLQFPARLLQREPWRSWLLARGGLRSVQAYIGALPLTLDELRLLQLLIERPRQSVQIYSQLLSVGRSTFYRIRAELLAALTVHLNLWQAERASQETTRQEAAPSSSIAWLAPGTLPAQLTELIGRAQEVATLWMLLQQSEPRLLTLTGPGGIGKTRLAIQAAAEQSESFAHGVCFVSLGALRDPLLLGLSIAQALGLQESGNHPINELLGAYLRDKQLLLVLDNFEQIIDSAPLVDRLLSSAPKLKVLITSREPLRLYGEYEFAVPPLSLPEQAGAVDPASLYSFEATRLFIARAQAVRRGFSATAENAAAIVSICRRLDGLPLAIELAAARTRIFSLRDMLRLLDKQLDLLVGGSRNLPERQQTLRATIDWSYKLLEPAEQALFARLAVFAGGCSMEAAVSVCKAAGQDDATLIDELESLLVKSLLLQESAADGTLRMVLLESVRAYALERLSASGELDALQGLHARYYLTLAERAFQELQGPAQRDWLDQIEREANNFRAALSWSNSREPGLAARIAGHLWRFWYLRGHLDEGRQWLEAILHSATPRSPEARALVLEGAAWLARQEDYLQALDYIRECLALREAQGDQRGSAMALYQQARLAIHQGSYGQAIELYKRSLALARKQQDRWLVALGLNGLGGVALQQGEHAQAQAYLGESLELTKLTGDKERLSTVLLNYGLLLFQQGDYAGSQRYLEQSTTLCVELENRIGIASGLSNLSMVLLQQGAYEPAQRALERSKALSAELGDDLGVAICLTNLGDIAFERGDNAEAQRHYHEGLVIARTINNIHLVAVCIDGLAAALARQSPAKAASLFGFTDQLYATIGIEREISTHTRYTAAITTLPSLLGQQAFRQAQEQGRALLLEQLLDRLLG